MKYIIKLSNELKSFESDIRDLCMAFFPYQKVVVEDVTHINRLYDDAAYMDNKYGAFDQEILILNKQDFLDNLNVLLSLE